MSDPFLTQSRPATPIWAGVRNVTAVAEHRGKTPERAADGAATLNETAPFTLSRILTSAGRMRNRRTSAAQLISPRRDLLAGAAFENTDVATTPDV